VPSRWTSLTKADLGLVRNWQLPKDDSRFTIAVPECPGRCQTLRESVTEDHRISFSFAEVDRAIKVQIL
jgi:hypothetical protein